jgi:hypothetical protein
MTNDIRKPASLTRHDSDDASDRSVDVNRREFMARSALLGVAAAAGLAVAPQGAAARSGPVRTGASGFAPLEVNSPMARWKLPQPVEWVNGAHSRFSFPNWQSGNDDSVYYNLNIPEFFNDTGGQAGRRIQRAGARHPGRPDEPHLHRP